MNKKLLQSRRIIIALTILGILFSCSSGGNKTNDGESSEDKSGQPIMVFAAASLTDVLSEIVDAFESKYQVEVKTNMASSGTLARQIEQGANPDVYISASKKWADYVDSLGYFYEDYKSAIAQNELVLIAPQSSTMEIKAIDSTLNFISLLGTGRLSIGDPVHVPAGRYAKQSLEYFGWYNQLDNKVLPAKDVRSALMVVEMEEAPIGIVYRTDAQKSDKVKVLNSFPEKSHKPIVYFAGVCNDNNVAKNFFDYLNSGETKEIWEKYGFGKQ